MATLDVIEPLLGEGGHVETMGARLADGLRGLGAGTVRGKGLWLALELDDAESGKVASAALDHGLVVNPVTPTALRLAPPLVVQPDEIDQAVARLAAAIGDVRG
jgi:acetylornithine aminotransferase